MLGQRQQKNILNSIKLIVQIIERRIFLFVYIFVILNFCISMGCLIHSFSFKWFSTLTDKCIYKYLCCIICLCYKTRRTTNKIGLNRRRCFYTLCVEWQCHVIITGKMQKLSRKREKNQLSIAFNEGRKDNNDSESLLYLHFHRHRVQCANWKFH